MEDHPRGRALTSHATARRDPVWKRRASGHCSKAPSPSARNRSGQIRGARRVLSVPNPRSPSRACLNKGAPKSTRMPGSVCAPVEVSVRAARQRCAPQQRWRERGPPAAGQQKLNETVYRSRCTRFVFRSFCTRLQRNCSQMHRLLSIVLAVALVGSPAVHASVAQGHDDQHHAQFAAGEAAAHHAGSEESDRTEIEQERANTHTACCPAMSAQCDGTSEISGSGQHSPSSVHSLAVSSVTADAMSGRNIPPETPPPRT